MQPNHIQKLIGFCIRIKHFACITCKCILFLRTNECMFVYLNKAYYYIHENMQNRLKDTWTNQLWHFLTSELLSWQLKHYVCHTGEMHFEKTGNINLITPLYFMDI